MPTTTLPRITVVLPAHDGGRYVRLAIESVLRQEHDAFELLILDDSTQDGSLDFLSSLADERVRLVRSTAPPSIESSFARVRDVPRAPWMVFLGHDDVLDPRFLSAVEALAHAHPDGSQFHTHFRLIDDDGNVIRRCHPMPEREDAAGFLAARCRETRDSFITGVLFRSALFDAIRGIPSFHQLLYSDDALWLRLMRAGPRYTASQELFSYRMHRASTSHRAGLSDLARARASFGAFLREEAVHQPELAPLIIRADATTARWLVRAYHTALIQANLGEGSDVSRRDYLELARGIDTAVWSEVLREVQRRPRILAHEVMKYVPGARRMYRRFVSLTRLRRR